MSRRILHATASAWTALILVLCWIPGRWLPHEDHRGHRDKLVHAGMFALFSWLWAWAGSPSRWTARILGAGLLLAFLSEAGQGLPLVGRDPDPLDVLADAVGVVIGLVAFHLWRPTPERSAPTAVAESWLGE